WEVFSIRDLQAFRLGQAVALDAVGEVGQSFFGQVNPGSNGPRPEPLDKVGAGAKANFEDPLAAIARELGKSMDERLVGVAPRFDLLEILAGKLFRARILGFATLAVPEGLHLGLQRGSVIGHSS